MLLSEILFFIAIFATACGLIYFDCFHKSEANIKAEREAMKSLSIKRS